MLAESACGMINLGVMVLPFSTELYMEKNPGFWDGN